MKNIILFFLIFFAFQVRGQWVVHDPINYATNLNDYLQQIRNYQQMLKDYEELFKQTKMLEGAFDEGGLWDETFKALVGIEGFLRNTRDVLSEIEARDSYALISRIPMGNEWKKQIYDILHETHGIVTDDQFDLIVQYVFETNPYLARSLEAIRENQNKSINHRLNSYYFLTDRKPFSLERERLINSHRSKISSFGDMSQGESTNMINTQLLLISQQNEEFINQMNHMIMTRNNDFMDRQQRIQRTIEIKVREHEMKATFDERKMQGFDF